MACIVKVGNKFENLSGYNTLIKDTDPSSQYFKITKFQETFTAGKNLFLMEGSQYLKESTAIKIEIVDVEGNTIYVEPGRGVPDYYEGNSVVLSAHIYDNIPVGPAKITVLGELREYIDNQGIVRQIPAEWVGAYNVKWERNFYINKNIQNSTPVIFYKRPIVSIDETEGGLIQQQIPTVTQSGSVQGRPDIPTLGTDIRTWRAGSLYRLEITDGPGWTGSVDENIISIPALNYTATVKEVLNKNTVLVDKPFLLNNKVAQFESAQYSTTFEYFDGRISTDTIVTGSYQRLVFKNIDTFTGNLDKIRIYRKSRSDISDFKFLEEVKVDDITSDLLVDETSVANEKSGGTGRLTEPNFVQYWDTQSVEISGSDTFISFDDDLLYESIKINVPSSSLQTEPVTITTKNEFEIFDGVDYEINLKALVSGSPYDVIEGDIRVVSESVSSTTYYLYDPTKLPIYDVSYLSSSGYDSILIQSASQDLTRNYVYDNTKLSFFDVPQNLTGSTFTSIPIDYNYDTFEIIDLTYDTTSADWGTKSIVQTSPTDNANVVSSTALLGGISLNVIVWLDSGSYEIPMSGNPQDVNIYSEFYSSGSNELAILSFENIGGDARFYYYNTSTEVTALESFRNSTEYDFEPIDTNDYQNPQSWHSSGSGSQTIIPFIESGYNYVHIDYRSKRNVERLNGQLITVERLDRLNGDILYGESYDIISMNFESGEIEFTDGTEADFSGTLNIENGQLILTINGETQFAYLVEADFNNSVLVFVGKITIGELEPSSTRYSLYGLFQLSGSDVINTSTSSFVVPRVPTQGGDLLYTEVGYPLVSANVSSRDYLTPVFDTNSSSLDFQSPLEVPYVFRNDSGIVTDVYTFDSSSGQIYNVSSVSSSSEINSDSYVYDNVIVQQGFVPSGSIEGSIYVDSNDDIDTQQGLLNNLVNLTFKEQSFLSGSLVVTLLTDSGSTQVPTGTGSIEYYIESFVSESGYQSGNTIWRNSFAFKNFQTDGMLFYNHSSISQSAMESYSGSVNYILSSIDVSDFQNIPLRMLESGSQAIFDFETSGSGYNFIYLDYRSDRHTQVLNADLLDVGLVDSIDGNPIGNAVDTFSLSGSNITSITSQSVYVSQVPFTSETYLFDNVVSYPFFTSSVTSGTYISDRTTPDSRETILNSPINIPYIFTQTEGKVNEVLVKRIDKIYTASSEYNETGTAVPSIPVFISKSLVEPDTFIEKTLKIYVTGSSGSGDFKQYIAEISADSSFNSKTDIRNIVTSTYEGSDAKLGIEARGDGWQISNIKLEPAKAIGFSPKVFKTVQEEERNLKDETFDYKFEMYDINNNYIPVKLEQTVRFSKGNKQSLATLRLLTFETDKSAFRFYSGSIANPPFQQIRLIAQKQNVSGSITYASAAFDSNGNYIEPSSYSGNYPGGLTSVGENGGIVTIANFSGSDVNYEVGSIIYTASVDDLNEYETVFRLEDGQPIADLIVNNDRSIVTFKQSNGEVDPADQVSTISVKRKNLASNTEPITINSSSIFGQAPTLTLSSDNSITGVATYYVSGSSLNLQSGSVTYEFTASDEFGVQVDNVTTITPISFLGGVVLYLSNERGVLPAFYTGIIPSSSYVYTSGSTKLYVDGEETTYSNSGGNNTYRITGVTGSGITPNEVAPTTNNYGGVPGTMLEESSSLEINVRYTDSSGQFYDFGREANFNIIREGEAGQPGLEGTNGPGLVFTGVWNSDRDYIVTTGSLARKDSVIYNDVYYLAVSESGPSTLVGAQQPPNETYWEELGTGSNFVAAEFAIFKESFVQNTINIGTNNSGSTSAANITIAGGTNYPWISIDQSADTGTQGYNVGSGIFLGINGNTGTGSFSLESPILGGNELLWDGNSLSIRGTINVTNTQDFITPTDTGSFTKNEFTQSLVNPAEYSFGSVFTLASASATTGLNLTADYLGYYDGSTFGSYMNSSGGFYLGGENGALQWDGNALVISGSIQVIGGNAATTDNIDDAIQSGSVSAQAAQTAAQLFASTAAAHAVTSGSEASENAVVSGSTAAAAAQAAATQQAINDASASINLLANGGWVGGNGTFITNTSISSPVIAGNAGYISSVFKVGSGITLDGDAPNNLNPKIYIGGGTWGDAGTSFYVDVDNGFSLGDKLTWDGDNLTIEGSITLTNNLLDGYAQSSEVSSSIQTELDGALDGYAQSSEVSSSIQNELAGALDGYVENSQTSSLINPSTYSFGPSATYQLTTPTVSASGLYLGNQYLGYYNGGWKTFMGDNGSFYLGGTAGALQWDGGSNLVISGSIYAENGTFSGNVDGATISGGTINIGSGNFTVDGSGNVDVSSTIDLAAGGDINVGTNGSISTSGLTIFNDSVTIQPYVNDLTGGGFGPGSTSGGELQFDKGPDIYFGSGIGSAIRGMAIYNGAGGNSHTLILSSVGSVQIAEYVSSGVYNDWANFNSSGLTVEGSITATGNITAYYSSDRRLKDNITPLTSSLIKISKIGGYEFDWNENQSDFEGHDVGVIAQEIQEVLPEVVTERKDGYLAVRYEKIIPLLIEGIKELTDRVEKLEEENKKLKG